MFLLILCSPAFLFRPLNPPKGDFRKRTACFYRPLYQSMRGQNKRNKNIYVNAILKSPTGGFRGLCQILKYVYSYSVGNFFFCYFFSLLISVDMLITFGFALIQLTFTDTAPSDFKSNWASTLLTSSPIGSRSFSRFLRLGIFHRFFKTPCFVCACCGVI